MSLQIADIKDFDPQSYPLYFFDTNIWLLILANQGNKSNEYQKYMNLFDAIVTLNSITDQQAFKRIKVLPKFVMTSMLLSEIINAYLRKIAFPVFAAGNTKTLDFKTDYRENNQSTYVKDLRNLTSNLEAFNLMIELKDDDFKNIPPNSIFPNLNSKIDFNDYYYYALMKNHNIPIVTHDKDFRLEGINIITGNSKLLRYQNQSKFS